MTGTGSDAVREAVGTAVPRGVRFKTGVSFVQGETSAGLMSRVTSSYLKHVEGLLRLLGGAWGEPRAWCSGQRRWLWLREGRPPDLPANSRKMCGAGVTHGTEFLQLVSLYLSLPPLHPGHALPSPGGGPFVP